MPTSRRRRPHNELALRKDAGHRKGIGAKARIRSLASGEPLERSRKAGSRMLRLLGPIPIYALEDLGAKKPQWRKSKAWRGLVMDGDKPAALIQFRAPMSSAKTTIRGRDAAKAFYKALGGRRALRREGKGGLRRALCGRSAAFRDGGLAGRTGIPLYLFPDPTGFRQTPEPKILQHEQLLDEIDKLRRARRIKTSGTKKAAAPARKISRKAKTRKRR